MDTRGVRQLNCLTPEDGTDWVFRNVGKQLPTHATLQARRAKVPTTPQWKPESSYIPPNVPILSYQSSPRPSNRYMIHFNVILPWKWHFRHCLISVIIMQHAFICKEQFRRYYCYCLSRSVLMTTWHSLGWWPTTLSPKKVVNFISRKKNTITYFCAAQPLVKTNRPASRLKTHKKAGCKQ
jgi:hypothetical protein